MKNSKGSLLKSNLRKQAIENYNLAVEECQKVERLAQNSCLDLYVEKQHSITTIKQVLYHINEIANRPKEIDVSVNKINVEVSNFENVILELSKKEFDAKILGGAVGTGITAATMGAAIGTLGPSATMYVALHFGVASTGTAISSLSGAAATKAALAWIGGGTLAAHGGGIAAGSALLGLMGPIGLSIAAGMGVASIGAGFATRHVNQKAVDKAIKEQKEVEERIRFISNIKGEIDSLNSLINKQKKAVYNLDKEVDKTDYSTFTNEEKYTIGSLVNLTLGLAELINKEIKQND